MKHMEVLGIIAEYNPFHNGHLYHLRRSGEITGADFSVAVMSGNFTQRGEPAMYDKWERARWAAACGVDLVLELPFLYACNQAEAFGRGAVRILNGLGFVTCLSFGSEAGSLPPLEEAAKLLAEEPEAYRRALKEELSRGVSYPKARENAVSCLLGQESGALLRTPNNILAVEYLKQLYRTGSVLRPVTFPRKDAGYHDPAPAPTFPRQAFPDRGKPQETGSAEKTPKPGPEQAPADLPAGKRIAAASGIRRLPPACRAPFVPEPVRTGMETVPEFPQSRGEDLLFRFLACRILTTDPDSLREIVSVSEGLEHKLKKEIRKAQDLTDLIRRIRSRRYPETRIRRMLIHILTGLTRDAFGRADLRTGLEVRILAMSPAGRTLLKQAKKNGNGDIVLVTNPNRQRALPDSGPEDAAEGRQRPGSMGFDFLASDLYNLLSGRDLYSFSDRVRQPREEEGPREGAGIL